MFGVLLSNLNDWYGTRDEVTRLDFAIGWAQQWVIESRFYSLLAFLFGLGFSMQLLRAEQRGTDVRLTFYRRMGALLLIGIVHGTLIWSGDILTSYALVGCMLLLFRDLSARGLVVAAVMLEVVFRYGSTMLMRAFHIRMIPPPGHATANWIYAHGNYLQVLDQRVYDYLDWLGRWPLTVYPGFLTLFILGLAVGRTGILSNLSDRLPEVRRALVVALVCVVVGGYVELHLNDWWKPLRQFPESASAPGFWSIRSTIGRLPDDLLMWGTSAVFACLLTFLAVKRPGALLNRLLAPVGRMPLTTYLTQSVVCTLLFYGYGFGLYGHLTYTGNLIVTLTLFAAQIAASRWWLARHEYGPVEWLWRSLTYGRALPLSRVA
jgi:uncharacterized protein